MLVKQRGSSWGMERGAYLSLKLETEVQHVWLVWSYSAVSQRTLRSGGREERLVEAKRSPEHTKERFLPGLLLS